MNAKIRTLFGRRRDGQVLQLEPGRQRGVRAHLGLGRERRARAPLDELEVDEGGAFGQVEIEERSGLPVSLGAGTSLDGSPELDGRDRADDAHVQLVQRGLGRERPGEEEQEREPGRHGR